MCNRKCCRVPTLVIVGVILTIVLVFITGITLTNSINLSNIVRLREKVASDSAAANNANAVQTRAALVEQQYSSLQQRHLSRSDLNYIAANHPKNLQRSNPPSSIGMSQNTPPPSNRIVIEIGLHNYSTNGSSPVVSSITSGSVGTSSLTSTILSTSTVTPIISMNKVDHLSANETRTVDEEEGEAVEKQVMAPFNGAIIDGNIESISVPAAAVTLDHNDTLNHDRDHHHHHVVRNGPTENHRILHSNNSMDTTTTTVTINSPMTEYTTMVVPEFLSEEQNETATSIPHWLLNVSRNAINNDSNSTTYRSTTEEQFPENSFSSTNYSSTLNFNTPDKYRNASYLKGLYPDTTTDQHPSLRLSIKDHNPAAIDFVKRNHIKQVCVFSYTLSC